MKKVYININITYWEQPKQVGNPSVHGLTNGWPFDIFTQQNSIHQLRNEILRHTTQWMLPEKQAKWKKFLPHAYIYTLKSMTPTT